MVHLGRLLDAHPSGEAQRELAAEIQRIGMAAGRQTLYVGHVCFCWSETAVNLTDPSAIPGGWKSTT